MRPPKQQGGRRNTTLRGLRQAVRRVLDIPAESLGDFVLIDGLSKAYAMTGWRVGFSWCEPALAGKLTALQSQITSNAATPSQVAALAALSHPESAEASIAEMVSAFRRRRDLVTQKLEALLPDVPYVRPEGAFYLYFRVDGLFGGDVTDATAWCRKLLEEVGVALVPGAAFGDDRWVRMSFASADAVLEDGLERIARMVESSRATAGS